MRRFSGQDEQALTKTRDDPNCRALRSCRPIHEITQGLRVLGVPVTTYQVDWAVAKSKESYLQLCAGEGILFPGAALQVALREGKLGFAAELLEVHNAPVRDQTLAQLRRTKSPVPRDLIAKIVSRLPAPLSPEAIGWVARLGTPWDACGHRIRDYTCAGCQARAATRHCA